MLHRQRLTLLFNFVLYMLVVHCPALKPPENGYFIQNTCNNHFNAACGVRCHPGFDLVGSSILLCLPNGLWSGSESSCRGMQTASSHCLLIVLLDILDLNSNGPVSFLFLLIFIDRREKILGSLKSELLSSIDHIIINYALYISFYEQAKEGPAWEGNGQVTPNLGF